MPDESDFRNYKTIEEFSKSLEGNKYLHSIYLKAVNHPIRREILVIVNKENQISKKELIKRLIDTNILDDENIFKYNMDFLIKAFCVNETESDGEVFYEITQSGKVVEYL